MGGVDFVINCYERTYRTVLDPAFMAARVAEQCRSFDAVTVLVNNVNDRADAERLAAALRASREVSRIEFVADHLDHALRVTGLRARHIRRLSHFTDCCLVAATLDGPDWFAYWDADATLREPMDWVTPAVEFMEQRPDVAVGNPNNWHDGLAAREALETHGEIVVGFGFSDVAFMARRSDLAAPIYRKVAPAAWRYPLAYREPVFEQRVDAWMRRAGRRRVTYLPAVVEHLAPAGGNYPPFGVREKVRSRLQRRALSAAIRVTDHPAVKAWPFS